MEKIYEDLNTIETKINKLNDFISLSLKRDKISNELKRLLQQANKVSSLMSHGHKVMQKELNNVQADCDDAMKRMRDHQTEMMDFIIEEKKRRLQKDPDTDIRKLKSHQLNVRKGKPLRDRDSDIDGATNSDIKLLGSSLLRLQLNQGTPKIRISDYKESPLVKRKLNNAAIQFLDFDVKITKQQFQSIPKYMLGRETFADINNFLELVIIKCFNEKYELLPRPRSVVLRNINDLELWKTYNDQETLVPGGYKFITSVDIARKLEKNILDRKTLNRITILRHVGVLQEYRVNQLICYIWVAHSRFNTDV
uniref:SKA complex subunit 1 n=1 Tax=Glossina austeni TaxID=7395 RepID=A0A1A9UJZ8_GLOAU